MITDDTAAKLREAALKANSDEWHATDGGSYDGKTFGNIVLGPVIDEEDYFECKGVLIYNEGTLDFDTAKYIALANPQTVLALLDERGERRRLLDNLQSGASEYVTALEAERDKARAMLFPYADATEISGVSFDGKYLIGDKKSVSYFHEMMNRGLQIDVYKRAYDERIAAAEDTISTLTAERDALKRERDELAGWCEKWSGSHRELERKNGHAERERDEARGLLVRVHRADALSPSCPLWLDIDTVLARTGEPKDE